jgi:ubiquinone/menaquinone biosynthesis C-methylase UbiE
VTEPSPSPAGRRGSYGIDAPYAPALLAAAALAFVVAGIVAGVFALVIVGAVFAALAALYLYATRRGKFVVWERLLDDLALCGDEQVADLGCGRGAVLLAVAKRLDRGTAHGVDVWRSIDQSGNDRSITAANARAEGVADRVELHTADLRHLPFTDGSIDVVTSSLAIHNLRDPADRAVAVDEAIRILRPGGRIVLVDIRATEEYARRLRDAGLEVGVTSAGPDGLFSVAWRWVKVVTATKPAGHDPSASGVTPGS